MKRDYSKVIVRLEDGTYKIMNAEDTKLPEHKNWQFMPTTEELMLEVFKRFDLMNKGESNG